jgi:RNA polymerase sigma factor (sigma-70 family)
MSDHKFSSLRDFLTSHYSDLKRRLTYRLGNADLASDALHDAYLRLQGKDSGADAADPSIAHPAAYLYRMAFHIAVDQGRSGERRLTTGEIDEMLDVADDTPGPVQIAEGRQDLSRLLTDLESMPQRRREILLAVRLDGATREQLAAHYGVALRTIDRELEKGYAFCLERMQGDPL